MKEKEFYTWLGKRIKELREKAGLKQKDVAKEIGISPQFLSDIENRGKKISVYQLNKALEFMGLTQADLTEDAAEKKNSLLLSTAMP